MGSMVEEYDRIGMRRSNNDLKTIDDTDNNVKNFAMLCLSLCIHIIVP